ncbi:MAG: 3-keto-5-aminohexanoate cleavage protein [Amphiplicatus sp.]
MTLPPVFITVAPNGARRMKADHPRLPMTAEEIATCAAECERAGAAMIHMHVRDADGRHSLDAGLYKRATEAVRRAAGENLIIQITTETAGRYAPQEQMRAVHDVRPEAVSIAFRELCLTEKDEPVYADFLAECAGASIWVQHILYSPGEVRRFAELRLRGLVPEGPVTALAVIGAYAGDPPSAPSLVDRFIDAAETVSDCLWSVCAFGRNERQVLLHAAAHGWNARTGFENNLLRPDGETAHDNAELVSLLAASLIERQQQVLSAAEVRRRHMPDRS